MRHLCPCLFRKYTLCTIVYVRLSLNSILRRHAMLRNLGVVATVAWYAGVPRIDSWHRRTRFCWLIFSAREFSSIIPLRQSGGVRVKN